MDYAEAKEMEEEQKNCNNGENVPAVCEHCEQDGCDADREMFGDDVEDYGLEDVGCK